MEFNTITELFDTVSVSEMTADSNSLVPLTRDVVERITEGDDDPKFATFVIPSGWSKSNRYWGAELFSEVAAEMNEASVHGEPVVGYQGHIPENLDAFSFPDIQLQWVGAKLMRQGDEAKLAVKAYVLPGTKARDYLKRGLVKTVSWRGKVAQEIFEQGGRKGVRIKKFMIESIDLSRPRAAGMNARMVGALSSEMESEEVRNVKPEEIAALTANELRAHNATLVQTIEADARKPLEEKVGEMEDSEKKAKPVLDLIPNLRTALGLDDTVDDTAVISSALDSIKSHGKKIRDQLLDTVLAKRFKDKDYGLLRTVLAGEMKDRQITITGDLEKDEQTVSEMVNEVIDGQDDLKRVVSEMTDAPPALPGTEQSRGGNKPVEAGYESSNLRVRSAR
jgi:hypothetical protein